MSMAKSGGRSDRAAAGRGESDLRVSRRGFLRVGAVAGVGAGLLGAQAGASAGIRTRGSVLRSAPAAKNMIFMVADGMSNGTLTLGDTMCRRLHDRPSHWVNLFTRPGVIRSSASTHSADSPVTDSSAGASAWGIGIKCNNGAVNWTPEGKDPPPLLVLARQSGRATGLVTTTRVTHATPAGFTANVPRRDMEGPIAEQILARGVDVVLGGGAKHFPDKLLAQYPDLKVVRDRAGLLAASTEGGEGAGRLLGVFNDDHVSYMLDRPETEPTLAEMAKAAIGMLSRKGDGFVMQIEGGRVDHAAHSNDAGSLFREQMGFDDAVAEAVAFAGDRDDTLVIITSDHGNANPGLTLYGKQADEGLTRLAGARKSFDWLWPRIDAAVKASKKDGGDEAGLATAVSSLVEEASGVALSTNDLDYFVRGLRKQRMDAFIPANSPMMVLGSLLSNAFGVRFLSPNHTSDFVEVTAFGPGSETIPHFIDNTDLHRVATAALRIGAGA